MIKKPKVEKPKRVVGHCWCGGDLNMADRRSTICRKCTRISYNLARVTFYYMVK